MEIKELDIYSCLIFRLVSESVLTAQWWIMCLSVSKFNAVDGLLLQLWGALSWVAEETACAPLRMSPRGLLVGITSIIQVYVFCKRESNLTSRIRLIEAVKPTLHVFVKIQIAKIFQGG